MHKMLHQLDQTLKDIETKFRATLPNQDGILLRPAIITDTAKRVSQKYKKLRSSQYSSLLSQNKSKPKRDWHFMNRVGSKAERVNT